MEYFCCYRCGVLIPMSDMLLSFYDQDEDEWVIPSCGCPPETKFQMGSWHAYSGFFDEHCHYPANTVAVSGSGSSALLRSPEGVEVWYSLK